MLNLDNLEVIKEPFPHAVLYPAFDDDLYNNLKDSFPGYGLVLNHKEEKNNTLYQLHAVQVDRRVPKIWRDFMLYCVSRDFWEEVKLKTPVLDIYPELSNGTVGIRYRDKTDVQLDFMFCVNSPVREESSVKTAHLDHPAEFFKILAYFPEDDDDAGGDLEIYKYITDKPKFYGKRFTDDVEKIGVVKYMPNTAIMFINTPNSLHGVTPREITDIPRRYINIMAESKKPLFELP